jgi:enamine deaminase RidA (YjgF/YER057c/UK114 family)
MPEPLHRRRFLGAGAGLAVGAALGWLAARQLPDSSGLSARPPEIAEGPAEDGPEARLRKLGLDLPPVPVMTNPLANAVRVGDMIYLSGHGPGKVDGKFAIGKLGRDYTIKQGHAAARQVGLVVLSILRQELGSLDKVVRLVKVLGMVNSIPEFTEQPAVINGFSELMIQVFGEKAGKGARSAVGMVALPGGIPVEIESIFQVKG